jgi:hypothetical protein
MSSALKTDADRIRDRYKRIGEAQNHVFGTGLPGSKPPDFNIDPNVQKQQPSYGGITPPAAKPAVPTPPRSETSTQRSTSVVPPTGPGVQNPVPANPKAQPPPATDRPVDPVQQSQPAKPKPTPEERANPEVR